MKSKIAVIGDNESVIGFKAIGFDTFSPEDDSPESAKKLLRTVANDYGIIFVTEQTFSKTSEIIERYKDAPYPAIIPIPGKEGPTGLGLSNVKHSVERAVGADILFNNQ
ncbi:MAG: V-type ATP synthase subunit F [Oscillospiraceae bacterium]|nr:V-type ATP synthase subunit F [Oscillospiraceae bacterium]